MPSSYVAARDLSFSTDSATESCSFRRNVESSRYRHHAGILSPKSGHGPPRPLPDRLHSHASTRPALVSSFSLFKLPESWLPYLAFEKPVAWRDLGIEKKGATFLGASVLPMGFNSSVGIMQHIHRSSSPEIEII